MKPMSLVATISININYDKECGVAKKNMCKPNA